MMRYIVAILLVISFDLYSETISENSEVVFSVQYLNLDVNVGDNQNGNSVITNFNGPCNDDTCQVTLGTDFNLSYQLQNASSCFKTSTPANDFWSGSTSSNDGEYIVPILGGINQFTQFKLTCFDAAQSINVDKIVNISIDTTPNPLVWPSCSGNAAYVLNGAEDRTVVARFGVPTLFYNGLYRNLQLSPANIEWPGTTSETVSLTLERNKYLAAKFTLDSVQEYKHVFQFGIPGNIEGPSPNRLTATISDCPGDFNEHLNQTRCKVTGGSFRWATEDSGANFNFYCKLEKGKTYYFNLIHSDNSEGNNYSTSDCPFFECGTLGAQYKSSL